MRAAADHATSFAIAVGDTHGPQAGQAIDCNLCHFDKAAGAPSATFKVFTCTNCHVLQKSGLYHDSPPASFSAWHNAAGVTNFDSTVAAANVAGVAPLDAACYACHRSGIAVDHAARFVLPHQNAAATIVAECASCHVVPGNRKVLGCAACHPHDLPATATGHAKVPDFSATDSSRCARCHEDGKIPVSVAAHAAGAKGFLIGVGVHAGAAGGACLACHPQNRTTAPRTFVADFKVTTCVGCHVNVGGVVAFHDDLPSLTTLHATVNEFTSTVTAKGLSAACLSCHTDGGAGAPSNHEQLFPRAAGTKHAGLGCAQCHGTGPKNDLAALACYGCHKADATFTSAHRAPLNHTSTGQNRYTLLDMTSPPVCLRCHAPIGATGKLIPITQSGHVKGDSGNNSVDHRNAGCVDCHGTQRSILGVYSAQDFGKRSCLTCHSSNNP
jgi:predicted CXXCH cytochrome family protein